MVVSALSLLTILHFYILVLFGVGSLAIWKFWGNKKEYNSFIVGVIRRIKNEDLDGFLQVRNEPVDKKNFNIIEYGAGKGNHNQLVIGGARSGKTTLGEELCLELPERKIIISFKRFLMTRRDFDIGYRWINVKNHLPNFWSDPLSVSEAFGTAFYAEATSKGLMIDAIKDKVRDVMRKRPKSFKEFFEIVNREAKQSNWDKNIVSLVEGKFRTLEDATKGAKLRDVDFSKGNIVLDFGDLEGGDVKTFFAEYYLRQINRIEEQEQRAEQIRIVIDEAWHLLKFKQQSSIVGNILLQGAYYIRFLCITQNYTHLDEDYRAHFGSIFCFRNTNDKDMQAIQNGYGAFVRDGVIKLKAGKEDEPYSFQFIDLKYEHDEDVIPVWALNYEKLQTLKLEAKAKSAFNEPDESFVEEEPQETRTEEKQEENLEERIISTLQKSEVAMYGYQIAKAIGLSPKDAVKIRQPLRNIVRNGKIKEIEIQVRKKAVIYYYLSGTETSHNFMMNETEQKITNGGWKIVFKSTHGTHGYDFLIEKDGKQIIIEVETGTRNTLDEFEKRVVGYNKPVIIVTPIPKQKERYSYLQCAKNGKGKIVLISELEEILKNW